MEDTSERLPSDRAFVRHVGTSLILLLMWKTLSPYLHHTRAIEDYLVSIGIFDTTRSKFKLICLQRTGHLVSLFKDFCNILCHDRGNLLHICLQLRKVALRSRIQV
jgi:hypothetical protein